MLKVLVIGYNKMLSALVSGSVYSGHKVVGALRVDRAKYSKFALFLKDIFNPSHDLSLLKAFGVYDIKAQSVNSPEFKAEFEKLKPDVILIGSWHEKLKEEIFSLPKMGCFNCHPSLLPKHRGANPYFWAIYTGEKTTGVTFHKVNEKFDCGDIVLQEAVPIDPNMTGGELRDRCSKYAQGLVGELLAKIERGELEPIVQNEACASYESQIEYKNTIIDLRRARYEIHNQIRALRPWYSPSFKDGTRRIYIKKHKFLPLDEKTSRAKIGSIIFENNKTVVARCFDALIKISK